jgi:20S proteasome subunit alpha 7
MAGTGADLDVSIFSADGRVIQVEYAGKAVDNSGTVIGICCTDGVVVAVEKIVSSKLLEASSNQRCHAIDKQAGLCIAGNLPDGKDIVDRMRGEAAQIRDIYTVPATGKTLSQRLGGYLHFFTTNSSFRPVGASVLLASFGDDGPQLYQTDPSGATLGYHACALGKAKTIAKTELEKLNFDTITCAEAINEAARILHAGHDSTKDKHYDVEIAWVSVASGKKFTHVPASMIPAKQ